LKKLNRFRTLFIFLFVFTVSCSQSDEQREFEREAINLPEDITETNENGTIVNGRTDPDDWRTAPFFQGIVFVDPPFPNPMLTTDRLNLNIQVTGLDGVSGLRVLVLFNQNSIREVYQDLRAPLPTGLTSISLAAEEIARFGENPRGLYRIIIEDRNAAIISYGDVRIE